MYVWRLVCAPKLSPFPRQSKKATSHNLFLYGSNACEQYGTSMGRGTAEQWLQRANALLLLRDWQHSSETAHDGHSPEPILSSAAELCKISCKLPLPKGRICSSAGDVKDQPLSLHIISHQTHFHPRNNTHIVWKENELRGIFSSFLKRSYCSCGGLVPSPGNSGGSEDSLGVLSQPGSQLMLQEAISFILLIYFCIRFTPRWGSLKVPSNSRWELGCKLWVRGCSFLTYTTRSPSSVKNASLQGRDAAIPGHSQQSEGLKEGQNGWEHEIPSKPELRAATADLYSKSHNSWAWMSPSPSRRDKVVEMAEPGYPR